MKKIIAFCSALLLAAAFTGCGKSSNDNSSSAPTSNLSESSNAEKPNTEEKIVVDPFDKVAYGIPKDDEWGGRKIYPEDLTIEMNASESPFGDHMTFTYFIESADENEIIIKARANVDEIQDFLDEYNYTVEETEKTFSINVADLTTNLISPDLISGENKTKLINLMQDYIESELKMSEDDVYENPLESFGIQSNNPDYIAEVEKDKEEFEKEKAKSQQMEFNLEKLYVIMPSEIQYNLASRKETSSITSQTNEDSFEDETIYSNKAQLEISSNISNDNCNIFGIFKDINGKYYCIKIHPLSDGFVFNKGIIEDEFLEFMSVHHTVENENGIPYQTGEFDDENSAYEEGLRLLNENEYKIIEIPLD